MTDDLHTWDLASVLRRRWRLIAGVAVLGTALVSLGVFTIPPTYTAKTQIRVEPRGLVSQASVVEQAPDQAAVLTEMTALSSHDLLERVMARLPEDAAFQAAVAKTSQTTPAGLDPRRILSSWIPRAWLTATGEPGKLSLRQLQRHLKVYQEAGSHILAVSVTSINPQEAAAVANLVTRLYVGGQEERKQASTDRTLAWLADRIPKLKETVGRLDAEAQAYRIEHGLASSNPTAITDQEIADLNHQLAAESAELVARKARLDGIRALRARGGGVDALVAFLKTPALTQLHGQELKLLQAQAALRTSFVQGSPGVARLNNELREVRGLIAREVDRATANLENEIQVGAAQVRSVQQRLKSIQTGNSDAQLGQLQRQAAVSRHLYENLLERQEALREQRESLSPGVGIVSLAAVPERPSSISPTAFIPPALVLFLIGGSFLAILKEQSDRTLRTGRQIGEALGVSCIGSVPRLRRLRRVRPHEWLARNPTSAYAETIRSLVASMHLGQSGRPPKLILVSSSVPGEGKTTLAVSFAAYAATLGRRVLLVDFDFRRPGVSRELGVMPQIRLLDLLSGEVSLAEAIQRAPNLPLDVLPIRAGEVSDPLKLFASKQIQLLLRRLRDTYDCVVIDSAPVFATAEVRMLAAAADRVLFAVKWADTNRDIARNALDLLRSAGLEETAVTSVITQVNIRKHASYHYGDSAEFLQAYGQYYEQAAAGDRR